MSLPEKSIKPGRVYEGAYRADRRGSGEPWRRRVLSIYLTGTLTYEVPPMREVHTTSLENFARQAIRELPDA